MSTKIQSGNHLMLKLFIIMLEIYHIMCFGDEFGKCVKSNKSPDFKLCLGQQLIQTFNDFESTSNFKIIEGIVLEKDDTVMSRNNLNFLEQDPLDYRSILESAGIIMGQRSLKIDLQKIYPGLYCRVGPTIGVPGSNIGMVEFLMDPNKDNANRNYQTKGESTARIMTRQFIVPFLLGIKFNLATLLPIIIGIIALLSKKALFFMKIAFMLSSFLGYGGYGLNSEYGGYSVGAGVPYKYSTQYNTPQHIHDDNLYKDIEHFSAVTQPITYTDNFYDFDIKQLAKDKDKKTYTRTGRSLVPSGFRTITWQSKND